MYTSTPFPETWPVVSFKEVHQVVIDQKAIRIAYSSLITLLFLPEVIVKAFVIVLSHKENNSQKDANSHLTDETKLPTIEM